MCRVGKQIIVTFPNFGYWKIRLQALMGHAPQTKTLPYHWYDTPNIRVVTISDFKLLCKNEHIKIIDEISQYPSNIFKIFGNSLTNTFSKKGIFLLKK